MKKISNQFCGLVSIRIPAIIIVTFSLLAINSNAQTYDPLAVQRINDLIANNGLQATPNAPETWSFAVWNNETPKQLIELNFHNDYLSGVVSLADLNSLQQLSCADKLLIELYVSNCSELQRLQCYGNNIGKLDVTNCSNLTELDSRENKLSNIDITTCLSLEYLMISRNNFNTLELTNLDNLKWLKCNFNNMSVLDITNCPNLAHLDCGANNLSNFNITNCPSLSELELSGNQFTELDLTNFTNLKSLSFSVNYLTEIDLSNCTSLFWLLCNENKLTSIDLTGLNNLLIFNAFDQNVPLTLSKNYESNYTCEIALNNPTFGNSAISYWENILTSTNSNVSSSTFTVQTGKAGFELSGTMNFTYSDVSIFGKELSNSLIAYVENDKLLVSGLKIGEEFSVYTVSGVLVYKGVATQEEESIILKDASGVYIVKSDSEIIKVIVQKN